MARKIKEMDKKTKEILNVTFGQSVSTMKEFVARDKVMEYINNELRVDIDTDKLCFKLAVEDPEKTHWMKNEHFIKIFHHELRHCEEYYSLSKGEKHFILDLAEFLKWEMNILVDEEDTPLNQTELAEKLQTDTRTIRRNMKSLVEKKIIYEVKIHKEVFYIVNPYLIFIGQFVNYCIPRLFDEIGYVNSSLIEKDGRSNRSKKQLNRIDVEKMGD